MKEPILKSATKISLLLIVTSVIVLNFLSIEVWEPLKSVTLMVVSFYFGQKSLSVNPDK